ncbi:MAG: nicotinate phosphoribosyltransferase [Bacteroidales bacterium]
MALIDRQSGLYTDHYELTMAQGFFLSGKKDVPASFDYFFRKSPFKGSYVIFSGLQNLLEMLEKFSFDADACKFLEDSGFNREFVDFLGKFRFRGNVYAPPEGEIVFPNEPVIWVEGNIIECQIIESMLLNIINFESLIATKASRIKHSAGDRVFIDFGLRRAQGTGSLQASRAAVIGGAKSTSNVLAAYLYNLQSSGTQAHSWVQSFEDELTAFREFARAFPDKCILLVDTYDTLQKGLPNAIRVAHEMEKEGNKLSGIRLDSGDLAYLSKKARKMLDEAGLPYVQIIASNQLDEYVIRSLREQNAPIDGFGVGTNLITGRDDAALDGVYKLVHSDGKSRLKISDNIEKIILPGRKKVYRFINGEGKFHADGICLDSEDDFDMIYHPFRPEKNSSIMNFKREEIVKLVMEKGRSVIRKEDPYKIAGFVSERLEHLPDEHKRFEFPHIYKVGISKKLMDLRENIIRSNQ